MTHGVVYQRKSLRRSGFDYSGNGVYFITIRSESNQLLFGSVMQEALFDSEAIIYTYNERSILVVEQWLDLMHRFPGIHLDAYSLMPDHFHGIIRISSTPPATNNITLSDIICAFKSTTTKLCNKMDGKPGRKIWQRSYYDRIIRDDLELNAIRRYIVENPHRWKENEHYLFSNEMV